MSLRDEVAEWLVLHYGADVLRSRQIEAVVAVLDRKLQALERRIAAMKTAGAFEWFHCKCGQQIDMASVGPDAEHPFFCPNPACRRGQWWAGNRLVCGAP